MSLKNLAKTIEVKPLATRINGLFSASVRANIRALAILAIVSIPTMASQLPDLGDPSEAVLTPQAEKQLGEQTMLRVRASGGYFNDPEVNLYLNNLGQRLVAADAQIGGKSEFFFFAVPSSEINAFALPGGYIGVNTGLILATESESELASVLAHEITHVSQHHFARQMASQSGASLNSIATLVAVILAAGSGNGQAASAAMTGLTAIQQQQQIDFTREHELEADRLGFNLLSQAGLDPYAMPVFFEHMQRRSRLHETQTPAYLLSHPLTTERIADALDRVENLPYRQVQDNLDFHLIRALLRSYEGEPAEAVARFKSELEDGRYRNRNAATYGYAAALLRNKDYRGAISQVNALEREGLYHPMIEALAAITLQESGQREAAQKRYRAALVRYPDHLQLIYDYPRALISGRRFEAAASFAEAQLVKRRNDANLHQIAAEANAGLGKQLKLHFHQGEFYAAQGNAGAAAEQFALAVRANDGSFQDLLIVENRQREIQLSFGTPGQHGNNRKGTPRETHGLSEINKVNAPAETIQKIYP